MQICRSLYSQRINFINKLLFYDLRNGRPTNTPCDRWAWPGITAHSVHPCTCQDSVFQSTRLSVYKMWYSMNIFLPYSV